MKRDGDVVWEIIKALRRDPPEGEECGRWREMSIGERWVRFCNFVAEVNRQPLPEYYLWKIRQDHLARRYERQQREP